MPRTPRVPEIRNTHVYVPAPGSWPAAAPCAECDHPKANRVHDVGEPDPEAAVIDARILGETQEQHQEGDTP